MVVVDDTIDASTNFTTADTVRISSYGAAINVVEICSMADTGTPSLGAVSTLSFSYGKYSNSS
jgi:hypothetical protein